MFQANVEKNWRLTAQLFDNKKLEPYNMLALLKNMGHMAFTDMPLIMQLEMRIV